MRNIISVKNQTGTTLLKGQVVYQTGYHVLEKLPTVDLASAASLDTSEVLGIVVADIVDEATGRVRVDGEFRPLDTTSFSAKDIVYLSDTAGDISTTPGTVEAKIGRVVSVIIAGTIFIRTKDTD